LPDISKINNVEVANISKLDSITFADGQKVNNQSVSLITDAHTFISSQTASSSSSLSFTSGIDSTYDVYEFHFIDMHPSYNSDYFGFQVNAAGQSGFNETITSTMFRAVHNESGSTGSLEYQGGGSPYDQAQGTSYQSMAWWVGADNDQSASGILTLYAPSSTTYVKHFTSRAAYSQHSNYIFDAHVAGYINTTSAIDEIDFKFSNGNIDAGEIRMYGVKG
tara:strand:- start:3726 stop:4388 length:663 start_codon:yes stop_codon:yes gene_type:complete